MLIQFRGCLNSAFVMGKNIIKNMPSDPKIKYQGKKIERHKKRDNHFVSQKIQKEE